MNAGENCVHRAIVMTFGIVVVATMLCTAIAFATPDNTDQNEYWKNGKLRVSKEYNDEGDPMKVSYYNENGSLQQVEKYDDLGHKIGLSYYDASGKLKETADGWASMTWKYRAGKMSEECYYDDQGKLTERKQYNRLGDLVSKEYVGDKNILPAEEYNPNPTVAGESITYDDQYGRPEATTAAFGGFMYGDYGSNSELAEESATMGDEEVGAEETAMEARQYGD